MITVSAQAEQRFYRDADRAVLGGVCAGLARHFGLNLKIVRLLTILAFLMAMPFMTVAYVAAVIFIPSVSYGDRSTPLAGRAGRRSKRRRTREAAAADVSARTSLAAAEIKRRCKVLDDRLAELEKHVTSRRYQIEQELSRL